MTADLRETSVIMNIHRVTPRRPRHLRMSGTHDENGHSTPPFGCTADKNAGWPLSSADAVMPNNDERRSSHVTRPLRGSPVPSFAVRPRALLLAHESQQGPDAPRPAAPHRKMVRGPGTRDRTVFFLRRKGSRRRVSDLSRDRGGAPAKACRITRSDTVEGGGDRVPGCACLVHRGDACRDPFVHGLKRHGPATAWEPGDRNPTCSERLGG